MPLWVFFFCSRCTSLILFHCRTHPVVLEITCMFLSSEHCGGEDCILHPWLPHLTQHLEYGEIQQSLGGGMKCVQRNNRKGRCVESSFGLITSTFTLVDSGLHISVLLVVTSSKFECLGSSLRVQVGFIFLFERYSTVINMTKSPYCISHVIR